MASGRGLLYRNLLATAVLMGSFANEPARSADLGGDCCADLEERVAELEATTVRKGNKKVSVTLYGQDNHAALFWDDGAEKNFYVVDNNYESSRFGFKGTAKTGFGDWVGGYRLEVEPTGANSAKLNQFDDDNANDSAGPLNVRHSFIYLGSKTYGEGRMGLTATPIYNITKDTNVTELEDTMHSDNRMMQGFFLRSKGFDNAEGLSKLKWQNISSCYDSEQCFRLRYAQERCCLLVTHLGGLQLLDRLFRGRRMGRGFALQEFVFSLGRRLRRFRGRSMAGRRRHRLLQEYRRALPNWRRRRCQWAKPAFPRPERFQELQARRAGLGRVGLDQA